MWRTNFTFSRAALLLVGLLNTINAIEPGKLGIAWNPQLLLEPEDSPRAKWGWTSIVEFEDDVQASLSNEEIVGIAIIARKDMQRDFKKKPWQQVPYSEGDPPFTQEPTVMTVIVQRNKMYFASSVKGDRETLAFTASGNKDVREALIACQKANEGKEHLNKANCGEPMVAHIAFQSGVSSLAGSKVRASVTRSPHCRINADLPRLSRSISPKSGLHVVCTMITARRQRIGVATNSSHSWVWI